MILGWGIAAAGAGLPAAPPPSVQLTSDCGISATGFADVDADGFDDLIIKVEDTFYALRQGGAWHWDLAWDGPSHTPDGASYGDPFFRVAPGQPGGAMRIYRTTHDVVQYTVDPRTGAVTDVVVQSEASSHGPTVPVGDLDGDGSPELFDGYIWYSATSTFGEVLEQKAADGMKAQWLTPIGDQNGDGFDDLLVGARDFIDLGYYWCRRLEGPAQLVLGGFPALEAQALWEVWADGDPTLAVGQRGAALRDSDALVVPLVSEGYFCDGDLGPGSLGVITDASTPDASIRQFVPVEQVDPDVHMPYLIGVLGSDVVLLEARRLQFFPWDAASGTLGPTPAIWSEPGRVLGTFGYWVVAPVAGQLQALSLGSTAPSGELQLLIWGRTVEQLGLGPEGWSDGTCSFWAAPYVAEAATTEESGGTGADTGAPPPSDPRRCSCAAGPGWAESGWMAGVALLGLRRRSGMGRSPERIHTGGPR